MSTSTLYEQFYGLSSFVLGENIISSCPRNQMHSCNHEEADTWIVIHIKGALDEGERSVLVCTVDTDVLVILTVQFHMSSTWPGMSFLIRLGMGENFQLLSINTICDYLDEEKCCALLCLMHLLDATLCQHPCRKARNLLGQCKQIKQFSKRTRNISTHPMFTTTTTLTLL